MQGNAQRSVDTAAFLSVNAGSTSIKFALSQPSPPHARIFSGSVGGVGDDGYIHVEEAGNAFTRRRAIPDPVAAVDVFLEWLRERMGAAEPQAVGHRIVYGGKDFRATQEVTSPLLDALFAVTSFDAEHLPHSIRLIETLRRTYPNATHAACFDSDFHRAMPKVARMLAIPRQFYEEGLVRLGFHGLSCAFVMREMARLAGPAVAAGRVAVAHLGGGCSVTAVVGGRSRDTSMGLTPAGGMMMAERCGDVDPGLAWRLLHDHQMSAAQFNHMVSWESGLRGVSGISGDLNLLLSHGGRAAADAVDLFCYQARKQVCAMAAAMEGIDSLVFTGGCGEHLAELRARVCAGLGFLGVELDQTANAAHAEVISTADSKVTVRVIHTDEQWMIAHEIRGLLDRAGAGAAP